MAIGKLFMSNNEEFVGEIEYQLHNESQTGWWGEFSFIDYHRINDGSYIIELEDERRGRCYLKKRVNRAVTGVPPRYVYHFTGNGQLENGTG